MTRLLHLLVAALLAAFAVAACGSDDDSGDTPGETGQNGGGAAAAATITIKDFKFGAPVTVKPGDTVKVVNEDGASHDVVGDEADFKTPTLGQGESATFTAPNEPGEYKFSCSLHPASMSGIGTLIVQG